MNYIIEKHHFEGPLDLLLHLIKKTNIDINDISIEEITNQYLEYINLMETLNLDVASEYLVMAAELLEIKSSSLLPKNKQTEDDFEEDTREKLIKRLLEYDQYKNIAENLKELEKIRNEIYTKEPDDLLEYSDESQNLNPEITLNDLLVAFSNFVNQRELSKPLDTKITNKEYNINKKCREIKELLKKKKKVEFKELFKDYSKQSVVVTFLAILSMSKKQEILIEQESNFNNIFLKEKGEI